MSAIAVPAKPASENQENKKSKRGIGSYGFEIYNNNYYNPSSGYNYGSYDNNAGVLRSTPVIQEPILGVNEWNRAKIADLNIGQSYGPVAGPVVSQLSSGQYLAWQVSSTS